MLPPPQPAAPPRRPAARDGGERRPGRAQPPCPLPGACGGGVTAPLLQEHPGISSCVCAPRSLAGRQPPCLALLAQPEVPHPILGGPLLALCPLSPQERGGVQALPMEGSRRPGAIWESWEFRSPLQESDALHNAVTSLCYKSG